MAYSSNPVTISRRQALLAPFLRGDPEIVIVKHSIKEARALQYQLLECMHIADLYPNQYAAVAAIRGSYRINVEHTRLIAKRVGGRSVKYLPMQIVPFADSVPTVIQAYIDHGSPLEITSCTLNAADTDTISEWAENLLLDIVWQGKKLTIR